MVFLPIFHNRHFLTSSEVLILSRNKQEYAEVLHHNFTQCVCKVNGVLDTLPTIYTTV